MSDNDDEISFKEAAKLTTDFILRRRIVDDPDDPEEAARQKRARETGEATAVLETMLAAGRHGKTVRPI